MANRCPWNEGTFATTAAMHCNLEFLNCCKCWCPWDEGKFTAAAEHGKLEILWFAFAAAAISQHNSLEVMNCSLIANGCPYGMKGHFSIYKCCNCWEKWDALGMKAHLVQLQCITNLRFCNGWDQKDVSEVKGLWQQLVYYYGIIIKRLWTGWSQMDANEMINLQTILNISCTVGNCINKKWYPSLRDARNGCMLYIYIV